MGKLPKTLWVILFFSSIIVTACVSEKPHDSKNLPPKENAIHPKEVNRPNSQYLTEMMELAKNGTVKNCPFNAFDSTIEQVKTKWGDPDTVDQAGLGFYATFNKKNMVLGYNKAGEIFDVRSYASDLKDVSEQMIVKAFGQPAEIKDNNNENIYLYEAGQDIQLKIIIPNSSKTIDHISVFNPKRAESTGDYILDIKGTSNKLTDSAWASMQKWRKEIVLFAKNQENVFINGPNKKKVALTFDDGPDEVITPAIIDILAAHHVKGNFFFIGSKVKEHPDVVMEAFKHGNLVLNHSYHHLELTKLSKEDVRKEIADTGQAIKSVIGKEPAIIRTPYGDTNADVAAISKQEGYSIVLWSLDTLDWSQKDSKNIVNNVLANVRNGDIILMHSDSDKVETKKALPLLIEELQKRNFEIVDLENLLNIKGYQ
ncbi:polysaccharide deacetylase family protein [Neobacillus sp. NPDC058068]|uniref:polysaccharide deacetylase family protein n=1 Tax=Neobacillus sp. NPDC058068 TaxID=3346325 RepID=UPI0036D9EC36